MCIRDRVIDVPPIDIEAENGCRRTELELQLFVYGERNGAEYWSSLKYKLLLPISELRANITLVDAHWRNNIAYPGSTDYLELTLENTGAFDLQNAVVTLRLPAKGFSPPNLTVAGVSLGRNSRSTIAVGPVDIDPELEPGLYSGLLVVDGLARFGDGSVHRVKSCIPVLINVAPPPTPRLEVLDYGWVGGRAYSTSTSASFYIRLRVSKPGVLRSIVARAHVPRGLTPVSGNLSTVTTLAQTFTYGDVVELRFENLNISAESPGVLPAYIKITYLVQMNNAYSWVEQSLSLALPILEPRLNITLIDSGWLGGFAGEESEGATAYLTFLSRSADRILSIRATAVLPQDVRRVDGSSTAVSTYTNPVTYGDIFTLQFSDLVLKTNSSEIRMNVSIEAVLELGGGYYIATHTITVRLPVGTPTKPFILSFLSLIHI